MAVNRLSKKDRSLTFERNNNKRIYKIKLKIFERKKMSVEERQICERFDMFDRS